MTSLAFSFVLSWLLTRGTIAFSNKYQLFIDKADTPKPQRFHTENISRGGGVGIMLAFFGMSIFYIDTNHGLFLLGAFLVFLSGFLEDIFGNISPKMRLCLQSLGVSISMFASDLVLLDLNIGLILPSWIAYPFTLFCVVGIINAMNIIDGFNGLCAGVSIMILLAILSVSSIDFVNSYAIILLGALLGFFYFNFPKGRIFLGDGGAYFIGFMLAFLLIALTQGSSCNAWFGIAVMVYPLYEVIFSIYRKTFIQHISPLTPDHLHFHALLYQYLTHSSPLTSLLLFAFNLPFICLAVMFSHSSLLLILTTGLFAYCYTSFYRRLAP